MTTTITPLRQRMIEDLNGRKLSAVTRKNYIRSCRRFAAFLGRSPESATTEDVRRFQLHLAESPMSICGRNATMTGLRFLFRVTMRRLDLANEIYHVRQPQRIPQVMSPEEIKRLLVMARNLKTRVLLSLSYGCGLRIATHCIPRFRALALLGRRQAPRITTTAREASEKPAQKMTLVFSNASFLNHKFSALRCRRVGTVHCVKKRHWTLWRASIF